LVTCSPDRPLGVDDQRRGAGKDQVLGSLRRAAHHGRRRRCRVGRPVAQLVAPRPRGAVSPGPRMARFTLTLPSWRTSAYTPGET
jgi:hypothetical protein